MTILPLDVDGAQRYRSALGMLGVAAAPKGISAIDDRGYSEQAASALGKDYLANATIILHPSQLDGGVATATCGAGTLLEQALLSDDIVPRFLAHDGGVIAAVSVRGPITPTLDAVQVCSRIGAYTGEFAEPATALEAACVIETPSRSVASARALVQTIELLSTNAESLFNRRRMQELKADYGKAYLLFGDLRDVDFSRFSLTQALDRPVHVPGRTGEAFFLPPVDGKGAVVLLPYDTPVDDGWSVGCVRADTQQEAVIDELFARDLIRYDLERGRERMDRIEEDILIQYSHHLRRQPQWVWGSKAKTEPDEVRPNDEFRFATKFDRFKAFQTVANGAYNYKFRELLGGSWQALRDVLYNKKSPSALPMDLRVNLLYADDDLDLTTRRLLARVITRDYPERFQHFRKGFDRDYLAADSSLRQAIIARMQTFNETAADPHVDAWLKDERIREARA